MDWLYFAGWTFAGFAGMEITSYIVHRFLFHGVLWHIHQTHHTPQHGVFEWNDLFALAFAALSMGLMFVGHEAPLHSVAFQIGLGIAIYGILYFIIHDLYTHRRFFPFKSKNKAMGTIRHAHQRHHQSADKGGNEPYGLFLFPYDKYKTPFQRKRRVRPKQPVQKP